MCAATEAVVKLFVRAYSEGGGLLVMEGAASLELTTRLFERHASPDELDDVGASDEIIDEGLRNAASHTAQE